jgi:endo-1,4-beta-xylanase
MKTAALLLAPLLATATSLVSRDDIGSLNQLFRDNAHKVYFGAATDKEKLEQGENANIIRDRFGQITPEYSAQWKETQPEANVWTKYKSNQVFNWAQDHQKIIRGHALLWHESVPEYINRITDKAEMRRAIETHIGEMMNPWKGKIRSWDVVNEIFVDNDPDGKFRDSAFYRVL